MQQHNIFWLCLLITLLPMVQACGPKCTDVKSAMDAETIAADDVSRINKLVERRKSLIEEGQSGSPTLGIDRMKFSVTAYELAIQIQGRIVNLANEYPEQYEKNLPTITDARCFLDEVVSGKTAIISNRMGKDIQAQNAMFKKLFQNAGDPSKYELKDLFENGILVEEPASEASAEGAEGEEGDKEGDAFDGNEKKETKPGPAKKAPKDKENNDDLDLFS